jgi:dTMP kinase
MRNIVAICGIDGSGKSTQVRLLEKYLKRKGFKVKYVWFHWTAFLSYPFLALCRLFGYTRWKTIERSRVRYADRRFYVNRALVRIWPWLFTLDALLYSMFKVKLWTSAGYTVLCDRFIPDILVDLMCETKDYELPKRLAGRLLLSLIPKNSKLIVIDVAESIAYNRKYDIPSIDYLEERRKLYLTLAKTLGVHIIDGEKEAGNVHEDILKLL